MARQDVHVQISRVYDDIRLHGKGEKNVAGKIRLLISWPQNKEIKLYNTDGSKM